METPKTHEASTESPSSIEVQEFGAAQKISVRRLGMLASRVKSKVGIDEAGLQAAGVLRTGEAQAAQEAALDGSATNAAEVAALDLDPNQKERARILVEQQQARRLN